MEKASKMSKKKDEKTVPLKKRKILEEDKKSEESGDGMDEDLYIDNEDREKLNSLPQLKREAILYERREQRKDKEVRKKLKNLNRDKPEKTKDEQKEPDLFIKSSSTIKDNKDNNNKKDNKESEKKKDTPRSEEPDFTDIFDNTPPKSTKSDQNNDMEVEKNQKKEDKKSTPSITRQDMSSIIVKREKLEQWIGVPYWKSAIKNVYVRIGVSDRKGRVYKLAEIVDDKEGTQTYRIGNKETNLELVLQMGRKSKSFSMKYISNKPIEESEFQNWVQEMEKDNKPLPTKERIKEIEKKIKDADNYVWTEKDVAESIKKEAEKGRLPKNLTKLKISLQQRIELSRSEEDKNTLEQELKKLEELELLRDEELQKKLGENDLINKLKLSQRKKEQMVTALPETPQPNTKKRKQSDADPFSRRSTQIEFGWFKKKQEDTENTDTTTPMEEEPVEEPKQKKQKTNDFQKHDFEIDIDFLLLNSDKKPIKKYYRSKTNEPPNNKTIISINDYLQNNY